MGYFPFHFLMKTTKLREKTSVCNDNAMFMLKKKSILSMQGFWKGFINHIIEMYFKFLSYFNHYFLS